jgi:hypothetical protein
MRSLIETHLSVESNSVVERSGEEPGWEAKRAEGKDKKKK